MIKPFDNGGFVGTLQTRGLYARVASLATHQDKVILLSAVGHDGVLAALWAKLVKREMLTFEPAEGLNWTGERHLSRVEGTNYQRHVADLRGTREKHLLMWATTADIEQQRLEPKLPQAVKLEPGQRDIPTYVYLFGNVDDTQPHPQTFIGLLGSMSLPVAHTWADEVWTAGMAQRLITPCVSLGIQCWALEHQGSKWLDILKEIARRQG